LFKKGNEINNMDKIIIDKFVTFLEDKYLLNENNKVEYFGNIINSAKNLISYGEHKIALENLLDNLFEAKKFLHKDDFIILNDIQNKDIQDLVKQIINGIK
jgi:hypothetical protein